VKDLIIETLVIEDDREAHIAKHDISINEVLEVLTGDYVYIARREERWLVIGKTATDRFLTVVIGNRIEEYTFGLVTARPARTNERSFCLEFIKQQGGEDNER
jgi:uncharacterized DUF497 family protein